MKNDCRISELIGKTMPKGTFTLHHVQRKLENARFGYSFTQQWHFANGPENW